MSRPHKISNKSEPSVDANLKNWIYLMASIALFLNFTAAFTVSGGQETFSTQNYSVSTDTSAEPGVDWLEVGGSVSGLSGVRDPVRFGFEYREVGSSSWNSVYADSLGSDGSFSYRIKGLSTDTDYEFRAVSLDNNKTGNVTTDTTLPGSFTVSGGTTSFTTTDYSVSTGGSSPGVDWLEVGGSVSGLSGVRDPVRFGFEYREVGSSSWNSVYADSLGSDGSFSYRIQGLNADTEYEYRATGLDDPKNGSVKKDTTLPGSFIESGGTVSFTTDSYDILTSGQTDAGSQFLKLRGELQNINSNLRDPIRLYIDYREKGSSTWKLDYSSSRTSDGFFESRISGLNNGTTYEYRARSENDVLGSVKEDKTLAGLFTKSGGVVSFATGPYFEVTIQDINEPIVEGNDVEVQALIENTGADGSTTLDLSIPGLGSNSTSLNLDGGGATTETLTLSTGEGDSGEYTANFSSGSDYATQDFNVSTLRPPVNPLPENNTEPVGLDWDLSAESNSSFETGLEIYIVNESGSDIPLGGNLSSPYERINKSLSGRDIQTGTEYEWYANSTYSGESEQSQVWNFTTVERPQVTLAEPDDESVDPNPVLNVTVDGNAPINLAVGESTGIDFESFDNLSPGSTVQVNTSKIDDFGEGPNEYWNVSLESYGAQWDNSDDFYNFTVADINGVDYSLQDMSRGDNLNPGGFGGLKVFGKEKIELEVSSDPEGATDMNFRINVSNATGESTKNFGSVDDGDVISVNLSKLDSVEENNGGYVAEAYYLEGSTRLGPDFESNSVDFSTHVAEIEFTHSGDNVDQFRVLYNESSASNYGSVLSIPIEDVSSDSSDLYEIGVANSGLKDNSQDDCYQVEAWNRFGAEKAGYQNGNDRCLGGSNP